MANILDAHRRRVKPPNCDLVDALREIHESKTAPDTRAVPHWPGLSGAGLHFPTFFSRLALESLTRGSEDLFRFLTPAPDSASGVSPNEARRYDALRGRLEQMEREARRHADAVDRLLERDEPSVRAATRPTPYQETLYLQCMSSGRSAGRFRCINRRGQPTSVSSVLRPFTMNGAPLLLPRPSPCVLAFFRWTPAKPRSLSLRWIWCRALIFPPGHCRLRLICS